MPDFQFESFTDFLGMGGYAIYVWPVYILFVLFFVITVFPPLFGRKKLLRQLRARMARQEGDAGDDSEGNA